jgi:hypothetical protein
MAEGSQEVAGLAGRQIRAGTPGRPHEQIKFARRNPCSPRERDLGRQKDREEVIHAMADKKRKPNAKTERQRPDDAISWEGYTVTANDVNCAITHLREWFTDPYRRLSHLVASVRHLNRAIDRNRTHYAQVAAILFLCSHCGNRYFCLRKSASGVWLVCTKCLLETPTTWPGA